MTPSSEISSLLSSFSSSSRPLACGPVSLRAARARAALVRGNGRRGRNWGDDSGRPVAQVADERADCFGGWRRFAHRRSRGRGRGVGACVRVRAGDRARCRPRRRVLGGVKLRQGRRHRCFWDDGSRTGARVIHGVGATLLTRWKQSPPVTADMTRATGRVGGRLCILGHVDAYGAGVDLDDPRQLSSTSADSRSAGEFSAARSNRTEGATVSIWAVTVSLLRP